MPKRPTPLTSQRWDSSYGTSSPSTPSKQNGVRFQDEVKWMQDKLDSYDGPSVGRPRARRKPKSRMTTMRSFILQVAFVYLALAVCFVCPSDTKREYGICRELDSVQAKLVSLEPYARPYFADVRQRVQPAVDVVRPYVEQARPYYNRIDGFVRPQATRAATIYRTQVVPKVLNAQARSQKATKPYVDAARAQFHRTFDPSIDWYTQAITQAYSKSDMPKHVATAKSQVALLQARLEHLRSWLPSMWHKLLAKQRHQPYYKMYERHWPWVKARYHDTAVPTVQRTYAQSKTVYFSHVRPQAITLWQLIQSLYRRHVTPRLLRSYSLYVAPQVDKINEKIYEYRAKRIKAEMMEEAAEAARQIAQEHDVDDFDEFIAQLKAEGSPSPEEIASSVAGKPAPDATPSHSPEELKAMRVEKRKALEKMHDTYERDIFKLGQSEHELLIDRLAEIRKAMVTDVPQRFEPVVTKFQTECSKMVNRMNVFFQRAAVDVKLSVPERVRDADFLEVKAVAKLKRMAEDAQAELTAYKMDAQGREMAAVTKAGEAIQALVSKAQDELGFGYTWLEDTTHKDWQRFHQLKKADRSWMESYRGLQAGNVREPALANLDAQPALAEIEKTIATTLVQTEKELHQIKVRGQAHLKGEWADVADAASAAVAAAGSVVERVSSSLASAAGSTATPTNFEQTASSVMSVARASATALMADARASAGSVAGDAQSVAGSVASQAQSALDAAYEAVPAVPTEPIASALEAATSLVQVAKSALPSVAPLAELAGAGGDSVSSQATEAASVVSSLAEPHSSYSASQASASVSSLESIAVDEVSTMFAQGQSAASGASSAVSSLAQPHEAFATSQASASVSSIKAQVTDGASSVIAQGASAASDASSVLSSLAQPHQAYTTSRASASVSSVKAQVTDGASSLLAQGKSAASDASTVLSSLAQPHQAYTTSKASASVSSVVAQVTESVASVFGGASE